MELDSRDLASGTDRPTGLSETSGRNVIAVIGIDRYHHWQQLSNAVRDARGAAALFEQVGFTQVTQALIDDQATGRAIQSLVTDDLGTLGSNDSLVIFYAGHGGTRTHTVGDRLIKTGYLIPADGQEGVFTWIDLEGWLRAISLLPPRHILVVVDACYAGIALNPILRWRGRGSWHNVPLATLQARRSRRIITSALDDQVACDSGPVPGHSLFMSCLIETLTHGVGRAGSWAITGSELGVCLQQRVSTYPDCQQTPDFGAFAFDERGEMLIPLLIRRQETQRRETPRAEDLIDSSYPGLATERPLVTTASPAPHLSKTHPPLLSVAAKSTIGCKFHGRRRRWMSMGTAAAVAAVTFFEAPGHTNGRRRSEDPPLLYTASAVQSAIFDDSTTSTTEEPADRPTPTSNDSTIQQDDCPPGMVPVPGGTFWMGSQDGEGESDEHPVHQVTLSPYCIDRTEVTVKAYTACVEAGRCTAAARTVYWKGYSAEDVKRWSRFCHSEDRPHHPINCIDWYQARAYCSWSGRRLPTEAEWELAARGTDQRRYPWGDERPGANRLNACGRECAEMIKREVNKHWERMHDAHDGWESTAPVGSFPHGASPFGVHDMTGNVWEWTADHYDRYPVTATKKPHGAKMGTARVSRGGGWGTYLASNVRVAVRLQHEPSLRDVDLGFRCAR